MRVGHAIAYGAVTIVNALVTGRGAALGIDTWTEAKVELTDEPEKIEGKILSDPSESDVLIKTVVRKVLERFNFRKKCGAYVETNSNIPIARGLKSSSTAANAIVLATLDALGKRLDDLSIVKIGVDAALEAGVTLTGAFDDACASYFGNAIVTDNLKRRILRKFEVKEDYAILIQVPKQKVYTKEVRIKSPELFEPYVEFAYKEAIRGKIWSAMTINGLIYSLILGYDPSIAVKSIESGAIACGLAGTGPSVAAVVPIDKADRVRKTMESYGGEIIEARINRKKAHSLPGVHHSS